MVLPWATSSALFVHQMPALLETGIPVETAAFVVTGTVVISVLWRVVSGWLADRFNKRLIMSAAMGGQGLGLLFFAHIHGTLEAIPFMLFMGAGYGAMLPLRAAIQAEYFGTVAFGAIQGTLAGIWTLGTLMGPVIVGKYFDAFGDYRMVFSVYGIITLLSIPLVLASKPSSRDVDVLSTRKETRLVS
jgi:MFS family permease